MMSSPAPKRSHRQYRSKKTFDLHESMEIDHHPVFMNNRYYVAIKPQGLVLEFEVEQDQFQYRFKLLKVTQMYRYTSDHIIVSDQILIPFAGLCCMDPDDAIIQYFKRDIYHTRTLASQYDREWVIHDNLIQIWSQGDTREGWKFQLSNPKFWQTISE